MQTLSRLGILVLLASSARAQGTPAGAQAPQFSSPHAHSFVTQLGAVHFPGGEASGADGILCSVTLPNGATIVAGTTTGDLAEPNGGAGFTTDLFVARFDVGGGLAWLTQVGALTAPLIPALNGNPSGPGGDASGYERPADLLVDSDGSLLVTGSTSGSLAETGSGGLFAGDVFLARFTSNGSLIWMSQLGLETGATLVPTNQATHWGDTTNQDTGTEILSDPAGGYWVAGSTLGALVEQSAGESDLFLAHYNTNGGLDWLRQYGGISGQAGGFNPDFSDSPAGLALSPMGNLVMAVTSDQLQTTFVVDYPSLLNLSTTGALLQATYGATWTTFTDMVLDSAGRVYVVGDIEHIVFDLNTQTNLIVSCYDPTATQLLWHTELDEALGASLGLLDLSSDELAAGIACDANGNLVVAGTTRGALNEPNAGLEDLFGMKLDRITGAINWIHQAGALSSAMLMFDASGNESIRSVDLGPRGTIYLAGSTQSDFGEPTGGLTDALLLRVQPNGTY